MRELHGRIVERPLSILRSRVGVDAAGAGRASVQIEVLVERRLLIGPAALLVQASALAARWRLGGRLARASRTVMMMQATLAMPPAPPA